MAELKSSDSANAQARPATFDAVDGHIASGAEQEPFSEEELLRFDFGEDLRPRWRPEDDDLQADWDRLSSEISASQATTPAASTPVGPGRYQVQQGDCISSVAYRAGFYPDTIWNHPDNSELRRRRKDPNVLLPGDGILIPEKRLRQEGAVTDRRHRFCRKGVPERLRIQLMLFGQPRGNVDYRLDVDGKVVQGTTDPEGWIDQPILPSAAVARLIVEPGPTQDEYEIVLGGMDPKDTVTGVQKRLIDLGYTCFLTGELDSRTRAALRAFQEAHGLEPSGEPDSGTCDALERVSIAESDLFS